MKSPRLITEGAVLLALFIILLLATLYIPVLNIILPLTLPLPFIIFSIRHSLKYTWILLVTASLLTVIVSSPLNITTTLTFGTTGIVLGNMYRKQRKPTELLLAGMLTYIVNLILLYIISVKFFEYNFLKELQGILTESIANSERIIQGAGMKIDEQQFEQVKQLPQLIATVIPTMLIMGSLMMSWFTLLIAAPILKRLRFNVKPWPPFRDIRLPKSILVYYIIFMIIAAFVKVEEGSYLYMVLVNLNILFPFLLVIQGFSLIALFFYSKGYSKAVLIITLVLSFFIPILFSLVSFLGIIDLGFSLRDRLKNS